jgi:hypothetical protein
VEVEAADIMAVQQVAEEVVVAVAATSQICLLVQQTIQAMDHTVLHLSNRSQHSIRRT